MYYTFKENSASFFKVAVANYYCVILLVTLLDIDYLLNFIAAVVSLFIRVYVPRMFCCI